MWTLRRTAVLQQLARTRAAAHAPLLAHAHARASAPVALQNWTRAFMSDSVIGVDKHHLLTSTPAQLKSELGRSKLAQIHRVLRKEFAAAVATEDATVAQLKEFFKAAENTRFDTLMRKVFDHLLQQHPEEINFFMYCVAYRALTRLGDAEAMWRVYEAARTHFSESGKQVPEIVYRFGIVSKVQQEDMATAQQLLDEMESNQVPLSNEIFSRVLAGYARASNVDQVLAIYEELNPQLGHWHETSIDRIILSLGMVGKPELAFEFYVNANMKLNGGTLITLLSVCRHNDCKQQAADILQNCKRFNLKLDGRGYNGILETLEFLDKHGEIEAVLEEMTNMGVAFDTKTKAIVARNQDALKGSYFDAEIAKERSIVDKTKASMKKQDRERDTMNARAALKQFLQAKQIDEAVAYASEYVRPLTIDDVPAAKREGVEIPAGALFVTRAISKLVAASYIAAGDHATVTGLLDGFSVTGGGFLVLTEIVNHYSRGLKEGEKKKPTEDAQTNYELAYRAAKLLMLEGEVSAWSDRALRVFVLFNDAAAAHKLCERQVIEYMAMAKTTTSGETDSRATSTNRVSAKQVATLLSQTLRFLGGSNSVAHALSLLDKASESGWKLDSGGYYHLLAAMRLHSAYAVRLKGVVILEQNYSKKPIFYLSDDFERVLDHIERHGVQINRSIVANVYVGLAGGERCQRLRLLEAYAVARESDDPFKFPMSVYSVLLQVSSKESHDLDETKRIYDDAVATLSPIDGANAVRVPLDWEIVFISALAEGGAIEEAVTRLLAMKQTSGALSYEATVKVLRGALAAKHGDGAEQVMALLQQREFKPTLADAYAIVHLAKDAELYTIVFDMLDLYEQAHGRETEDAVGHSRSHQSARDKFAVRKIRSMYRVALKLCEQNGEWKRALAFSTRVNELLRFETDDSKEEEGDDSE